MAKLISTLLCLVIVSLVVDARSTHPRRASEKIVGGGFATEGQFPHQVALFQYVLGQWSFYCGGTLISVDMRGGEFFFDDLTGHEQEILGKTNHIHPGYNPELLLHDIAILELSSAFTANDFVGTIALPATEEVAEGSFIRVTGWGPTVSGGLVSRRLHFLDLTYGTFETCDAAYPGLVDQASTFCAGVFEKGSCGADSGSPVTYSRTVIGVVSRTGCGDEGLPDVYTKVSHYLDWINETMG